MTTFRMLQFNMQFGQQWDEQDPDRSPVDLKRTIAEIVAQEADVICLQEVEQARPGGQQVEPPPNYQRLRAALPGYHGTFAYPPADTRELPFGLGLATFSRAPLERVFREVIPSPPVEFDFHGETKTPTDRILLGADTELGGRTVRVINLHLLAFFMLKSSSEFHGDQRARVVKTLQAEDRPTLLAGDFNVSNTGSLTHQFAAAGYRTTQDREVTWRRQPLVLDHVFYNAPLRCLRSVVKPTPTSDHHMLIADFCWDTPAGAAAASTA